MKKDKKIFFGFTREDLKKNKLLLLSAVIMYMAFPFIVIGIVCSTLGTGAGTILMVLGILCVPASFAVLAVCHMKYFIKYKQTVEKTLKNHDPYLKYEYHLNPEEDAALSDILHDNFYFANDICTFQNHIEDEADGTGYESIDLEVDNLHKSTKSGIARLFTGKIYKIGLAPDFDFIIKHGNSDCKAKLMPVNFGVTDYGAFADNEISANEYFDERFIDAFNELLRELNCKITVCHTENTLLVLLDNGEKQFDSFLEDDEKLIIDEYEKQLETAKKLIALFSDAADNGLSAKKEDMHE